jgi:hypothetical protein
MITLLGSYYPDLRAALRNDADMIMRRAESRAAAIRADAAAL